MKTILSLAAILFGSQAAEMPHEGMRNHHQSTEVEQEMLANMDDWYANNYHSYVGEHQRLQQDAFGDLVDDVELDVDVDIELDGEEEEQDEVE